MFARVSGVTTALVVKLGAATAAAADTDTQSKTIRIDPSRPQPAFEGGGASLAWFANATGGHPEPIRRRLVDMLFGPDGPRVTIARHHIGGGNAPDVRTNHMKNGATMRGFREAPAGTAAAGEEWSDPAGPDHGNLGADASQRWSIDQLRDDVDIWEAVSNSPSYFPATSGYVSGGFDSSTGPNPLEWSFSSEIEVLAKAVQR